MTFRAICGEVVWITEGGPRSLDCQACHCLLAIFDQRGAVDDWRILDRAMTAVGYPPSVSSLRAVKDARAA